MEHAHFHFMKPVQAGVKGWEALGRTLEVLIGRQDVVNVYSLQESSSDWVPAPWLLGGLGESRSTQMLRNGNLNA